MLLIEFDVLPARSKILANVDWYVGFKVLTTVVMKGSIHRAACWKSTDVSEEYVTLIFSVEECAKQEATTK
jgi:hypothetical protein